MAHERFKGETMEEYRIRRHRDKQIDKIKKHGKWLTRKPGLAERIAIEQAKKEQKEAVSKPNAEAEGTDSGNPVSEVVGEVAESTGIEEPIIEAA